MSYFQTTCTFAQLFKVDYKYSSIIPINDWTADGVFLDLYLKVFQENFVYKEPCFERKIKSEQHLTNCV